MNINIFIENTNVEGKITHRSASDITVQISKPYSNISTDSHIPCFVRGYRSFYGVHGDTTAELLRKKHVYSRIVIKIMDTFFENDFPMCIPYGTRELMEL